jgi:hypothetical protein
MIENAYRNLIPTRNRVRIGGLDFGFDKDSKITRSDPRRAVGCNAALTCWHW